MSNYTKTTDFEAKDSLPTGDSGKIIRGAEFETEFDAISTAIATKADTAGPTFTGTLTFETISDGTIGVTAFVDEDDMSSDSATLVPTQQSVKAYVDAQVTAQDLDFQADTGGALSIDLDSETLTFTGGTGIDTSGSGNAVTFAIDSTVATLTGTQTLTNKTLTSPDVNTPDIDGGTIDGATIATSDITVGTGKTLDVSGGTLTLANDQISGDKVEGGTIASTTITSLASTTVDTTNLEVTNIKAKDGTSAGSIADTTGVVTLASSVLTTTDINGGTIDGVTIGGSSAGAITGTTITGTGFVTSGDMTFGDNDKAIFGAGNDLQIYHDGSNSFIDDQGTGSLVLQSNGAFTVIQNSSGVANARFDSAGAASLRYNGSEKLATTSSGIDVTGTVTADGLTTEDDASNLTTLGRFSTGFTYSLLRPSTNATGLEIRTFGGNAIARFLNSGVAELYNNASKKLATTSTGIDVTGSISADGLTVSTSGTNAEAYFDNGAQSYRLLNRSSDNAFSIFDNTASAFRLTTASNGDISFYEDTGTTAKLFWDASDEALRIGGTSNVGVSEAFTVYGDSSNSNYPLTSVFADTSAYNASSPVAGGGLGFAFKYNTGGSYAVGSLITGIKENATDGNYASALTFRTRANGANPVEQMRIDSSGQVGVGEDNPFDKLVVRSSDDNSVQSALSLKNGDIGNSAGVALNFVVDDNNDVITSAIYGQRTASAYHQGSLQFLTRDSGGAGLTERMRIDSSGNLLVGTTTHRNFSGGTTEITVGTSTTGATAGGAVTFDSGSGFLGYVAFQESEGTLGTLTSVPLLLKTGNTERMRIDSSGSVGIGTTSPQTSTKGLHIVHDATEGTPSFPAGEVLIIQRNYNASQGADLAIISGSQSGSSINFGDKDSSQAGRIQYDNNNNAFRFFTNGANERMRIDSSGNVNIATTSAYSGAKLSVNGGIVQANGTQHVIGTYGTSGLQLIGTAGGDNIVGTMGSSEPLIFRTVSAERMRIDSSGNLLVGKTSVGLASTGFQALASGNQSAFVSDGDRALILNRQTSDGSVLEFRKDGSTVGSIGSDSNSNFMLGQGDTGLSFQPSSDRIIPRNTDGFGRDNAIDLGGTGNRFKDLYLSGGVYVGGTGSANHLDDYEEGTWTPALEASTTNPTPTAVTVNNATYTKVGRMVHVQAYITVNLTSVGSGGAQITGLPFTVGTGYAPVLFTHGDLILSSGGYFNNNSTKIIAITNNSTSSIGYAGTGTKSLMISGTYEVA